MRKVEVYYQNELAGILTETDDGHYIYEYTNDYISQFPKQFISFTMPVSNKKYEDKKLFAFFEGLIPEGWLLEIASKNWKINQNDRMGLLMACCQNCIGAVSIKPIIVPND
jgi:serine/threonine-protein kinase HipA